MPSKPSSSSSVGGVAVVAMLVNLAIVGAGIFALIARKKTTHTALYWRDALFFSLSGLTMLLVESGSSGDLRKKLVAKAPQLESNGAKAIIYFSLGAKVLLFPPAWIDGFPAAFRDSLLVVYFAVGISTIALGWIYVFLFGLKLATRTLAITLNAGIVGYTFFFIFRDVEKFGSRPALTIVNAVYFIGLGLIMIFIEIPNRYAKKLKEHTLLKFVEYRKGFDHRVIFAVVRGIIYFFWGIVIICFPPERGTRSPDFIPCMILGCASLVYAGICLYVARAYKKNKIVE